MNLTATNYKRSTSWSFFLLLVNPSMNVNHRSMNEFIPIDSISSHIIVIFLICIQLFQTLAPSIDLTSLAIYLHNMCPVSPEKFSFMIINSRSTLIAMIVSHEPFCCCCYWSVVAFYQFLFADELGAISIESNDGSAKSQQKKEKIHLTSSIVI